MIFVYSFENKMDTPSGIHKTIDVLLQDLAKRAGQKNTDTDSD